MKPTKHECDECHRFFVSIDALDDHIRLKHELNIKTVLDKQEQEETDMSGEFECDEEGCDFTSAFERGIKSHKTKSHGAPGNAATQARRAARQAKMREESPIEIADADWRSLGEKLVQENQNLSLRVTELTKKNYTLAEELTVLREAAQGGQTQQERELAEQVRHLTVQNNLLTHDLKVLNTAMKEMQENTTGPDQAGLLKLRLYLDGDPDGTTEEARLGFRRCYEMTMQTNEKLLEDIKQAKQGIIPETWLKDIKKDFEDSVAMVVEAIQESAKDSAKVRKYDDLMKLINGN